MRGAALAPVSSTVPGLDHRPENLRRHVNDYFELEPLDDAVECSAFASVAARTSSRR